MGTWRNNEARIELCNILVAVEINLRKRKEDSDMRFWIGHPVLRTAVCLRGVDGEGYLPDLLSLEAQMRMRS